MDRHDRLHPLRRRGSTPSQPPQKRSKQRGSVPGYTYTRARNHPERGYYSHGKLRSRPQNPGCLVQKPRLLGTKTPVAWYKNPGCLVRLRYELEANLLAYPYLYQRERGAGQGRARLRPVLPRPLLRSNAPTLLGRQPLTPSGGTLTARESLSSEGLTCQFVVVQRICPHF